MSRNSITNLENGRLAFVSIDDVASLAAALGVDIEALTNGSAVTEAARARAAELRAEAERIEREAGLR